jgi:hypothetical protein
MKPIEIQISDDTDVDSVIGSLDSKFPQSTKDSPEFAIIYPQVVSCIQDFTEKAKKLAKAGTTIHIKKEFSFPYSSILVVLDYPKKAGFLQKLSGFLKRD